ncbi:MAG TPA: 6-hydroxycyclohex-1-ene-1-carbonyl-CoA dehydrogenase [Longimicrobiales bacterium]|nr:6-hydroxycyclohex-1-ene-1-carbonyl-CoA dehydrogenase [Longimicrobiales bacterium]
MEAIQLIAAGAPLELREVGVPEPGPDEVVVQVAGCGVCHTDIGFWKEGVATRRALPLTLGHEISGVVAAAGARYRQLQDREVIVPAVIPCGQCELCRAGRSNICRSQVMPGNDLDGGFAEFVRVPGRGLCVVEERGGYDLAELSVIADAVTTPYQAVVRSGLGAGDLAIVVGAGGVGGYCVQIAAALGARVIAIDVNAARRDAAAAHGGSLVLDPTGVAAKSLRRTVSAAAADWGCAAHSWKIYECSGHPAGQEAAYGLLTYAATLMVIGFTMARTELRLSNLMAFDATVQGTWGCRPELYPAALQLVTDGRVALRPFIRTYSLGDGVEVLRRTADHELDRRAILVPGAIPQEA